MRYPIRLEGQRRQPCSTTGATDVALVKLVLAGAPSQWLWVQPEARDSEDAPDWQALERAISTHRREAISRLARPVQPPFRQSRPPEIWRELGRLWREFVRRWRA